MEWTATPKITVKHQIASLLPRWFLGWSRLSPIFGEWWKKYIFTYPKKLPQTNFRGGVHDHHLFDIFLFIIKMTKCRLLSHKRSCSTSAAHRCCSRKHQTPERDVEKWSRNKNTPQRADPDSQNAAELAILTYILLKTTVAMFHLKLMIFQKNISFFQVVHVEVLWFFGCVCVYAPPVVFILKNLSNIPSCSTGGRPSFHTLEAYSKLTNFTLGPLDVSRKRLSKGWTLTKWGKWVPRLDPF